MAYRTVQLDLTAPFASQVLANKGEIVSTLNFVTVPTGAAATVRLGNGQPIPIVQGPWTNIQTDIDDAVNGVFADNAVAQPGVVIVCVVSFIAPGSPSARAFQVQNT